VLLAYTQLRLARPIAADTRLPWERPLPTHRLTPTRVNEVSRHCCRCSAPLRVRRNPAAAHPDDRSAVDEAPLNDRPRSRRQPA